LTPIKSVGSGVNLVVLPRKVMALSNQVKGSLDEASRHLRDALAFAARTEHPVTINAITELMCRLDSLEKIDMIIEKFDTNHEVPHPFRG
jgi:hypothetical protein